jgi:hypothetical protein
MTKTIKKTNPTKVYSYLGREAEVTIHLLQSKDTGERINIMKWLDNGDLQLRHIKGDGRIVHPKPDLQVFADVTIPNGTTKDADKFIQAITNA